MSSINTRSSSVILPQDLEISLVKPIQVDQKSVTEEIIRAQAFHIQPAIDNKPELTPPQQVNTPGPNMSINDALSLADNKTDSRDVNYLEKSAQFHGDNLTSHFSNIQKRDINSSEVADTATVRSCSFKNMFGDLNMLSVSNFVVLMTNRIRTLFNNMTADSIRRMVDTAINAGKHIIAAANQNFRGALTSGIIGSSVQIGTGVTMSKAIKNENKSIDVNLKPASSKSLQIQKTQDDIKKALQQQQKEGQSPDAEMVQNIMRSEKRVQAEAASHQNDHQIKVNKTYQTRTKADVINQLNHAGQQAIVAGFGVNAATETSVAEVLKSGQQVHHDIADNQKQVARSVEETQAAINQFVDAWIANNNSAVSSIAGR